MMLTAFFISRLSKRAPLLTTTPHKRPKHTPNSAILPPGSKALDCSSAKPAYSSVEKHLSRAVVLKFVLTHKATMAVICNVSYIHLV